MLNKHIRRSAFGWTALPILLTVLLRNDVVGAPIHDAASSGNLELVQRILKADGSQINSADRDEWTVLDHAITSRNTTLVAWLIDNGARLCTGSPTRLSSLFRAKLSNRSETILLLSLRQTQWDMIAAAAMNRADVIEDIAKGDPASIDLEVLGWTPLSAAAHFRATDSLDRLISLHANVNRTCLGHLPIHVAAGVVGNDKCLLSLLLAGSDVNARGRGGATSAHIAAGAGSLSALSLLKDYNADLHARDNDGAEPIDYGLESPSVICFLFLRQGYGQQKLDELLINACARGLQGTVAILMRLGANANSEDREDTPAIHFAARSGDVLLVASLISAGADVAAKDRSGRTALESVSERKDFKMNRVLKRGEELQKKMLPIEMSRLLRNFNSSLDER